MSLYQRDIAQEKILADFLSNHYKLSSLRIKRIDDKSHQLAGVDLILEADSGLEFKVDEKAQLHYLNKDLPTFALEINYYKDREFKEGWLFDSKKVTEIYAFVFSIHLLDGLNELKSEKDISSCEVIFIRRIKLMNELSKLGLDYSSCLKASQNLRSDDKLTKIEHGSGFNFQISRHLEELPINLVVRKKFLESHGIKYRFPK